MSNNVDLSQYSGIIEELKCKKNVVILCHANPDGDTVGSAYALGLALSKLGATVKIECSDEFPDRYNHLTKLLPQTNSDVSDYVVAVDVADIRLLDSPLKEKYAEKIDLAIDHHGRHKNFAKNNIVVRDCAANCEIVYYFINCLGVEIDADIADCIYTGIATDTGSFQHSNTTAQSHNIVASLINKTPNIAYINQKLFKTKTKKDLELLKLSIENLDFFFDGKCAMLIFTKDVMEKYAITSADISLVKSLPVEVANVEVGFVLREEINGQFKLSMRSNGNISASEICSKFEGGGHFAAAGGTVYGDKNAVVEQVLSEVKKYLRVD